MPQSEVEKAKEGEPTEEEPEDKEMTLELRRIREITGGEEESFTQTEDGRKVEVDKEFAVHATTLREKGH